MTAPHNLLPSHTETTAEKPMRITKDWLVRYAPYSRDQFDILGLPFPPPANWMTAVIGKELSAEDRRDFELCKAQPVVVNKALRSVPLKPREHSMTAKEFAMHTDRQSHWQDTHGEQYIDTLIQAHGDQA